MWASFFADGGSNAMGLNFTAVDANQIVEGIGRLAGLFRQVIR